MLLFLPIMLCCIALKIYPIMLNIMLKNKNCGQSITTSYALYIQVCMNKLLPVVDHFRNTVYYIVFMNGIQIYH